MTLIERVNAETAKRWGISPQCLAEMARIYAESRKEA